MKSIKKIFLSLIMFVGVAIASVIAFVGNQNLAQKLIQDGGANNVGDIPSSAEISTNVDTINTLNEKLDTITYEADTLSIQRGGSTLNYAYSPNVNQTSGTTIAYEYVFKNTMDRATAVNLKSIDTTGVSVSYTYSTTKLDTSSEITGEIDYTLQKLENYGDKVYIYVIVSPTDETIPTTFTTSIVWYYGIPKTIYVSNSVDNTTTTQTIVNGQKIYENTLSEPSAPSGYEFEGWYLDEELTTPATYPFTMDNIKLYAKFSEFTKEANLPSDWIAWDSSTSSYYICQGTSTLPDELIISGVYNDGTHGDANITYVETVMGDEPGIYISILFNTSVTSLTLIDFTEIPDNFYGNSAYSGRANTKLTSIDLSDCDNLTSIGNNAFLSCTALTTIDLSNCTNLTSIGDCAFYDCSSLPSITIPSSVTSLGDYAFQWCGLLTSITIPSNVTSIGDFAFFYCTSLTSITIPSSVTKIGSRAFDGCSKLTSITFEDTSGWYRTNNSTNWNNMTGGTSTNVTNASTNATHFTSTYCYYYWYKQ